MSRQFPLSGPDAVQAADLVRVRAEKNRAAWPYEDLQAPPDAVPVNQPGIVDIPAQGSTATVASYKVPAGFRLILRAILLDSSPIANPGDTSWTVTQNPNAGAQANPVQGLIAIPFNLGSYRYGTVFVFPKPYSFAANDVISAIATNVNLISSAGNVYCSALIGYLVRELAPKRR